MSQQGGGRMPGSGWEAVSRGRWGALRELGRRVPAQFSRGQEQAPEGTPHNPRGLCSVLGTCFRMRS